LSDNVDHHEFARLFALTGFFDRAEEAFCDAIDANSGERLLSTQWEFSMLLKRQKRWHEALVLWTAMIENNSIKAFIEIAKYHEHHSHNYPKAVEASQLALQLSYNEFQIRSKDTILKLEHRLKRLHAKTETSKSDTMI